MFSRTRLAQFSTYSLLHLRHNRPLLPSTHHRSFSEIPSASGSEPPDSKPPESREGWLFVDSVFPIQIARWDFRHYVGIFREEYLLGALKDRLDSVKAHNFKVLSLESHRKDGGVFIRFFYSASDPESALKTIESQLAEESNKHGGLPSWLGLKKGCVWLVKGTPWKEDMNRFASPILKVAFEGPDVHEQSLYQLFRPYGRIQSLTEPGPVPAGTLRSSTITFSRIHSATVARNVVHGFKFPSIVGGNPHAGNATTLLRAAYQRPVQAHAIRDWMSSHPKIVLPLLVFFFGTLTYTIFDPIRSLTVQGKMMNWFDVREFQLYKWLRMNTLDRLSRTFHNTEVPPDGGVWREQDEAVRAIKSYLSDFPTTVAFVHGPQGSGKTRMLDAVLKESGRKALIIDCRSLQKATSDTHMIAALAKQTGYWPIFTFLNSINNLVDLASVGLIGQKAGLSSSLADQLQQILTVVATALKGFSSSQRAAIKKQIKNREREEMGIEAEERRRREIRRGTWHDGRLDAIAGNGIMSELGVGDELLSEDDGTGCFHIDDVGEKRETDEEAARKQRTKEEIDAVGALPIVVIRNYAAKVGSGREELLTVLAQWAAMLAENQIAHVLVISDNRENSKYLAKALPSKPLTSIALFDADTRSAISFVKQKLRDADIQADFTPEQTAYVERLGGRTSDLESLIHKVRNGQRIEEAVEDIITRGVGELRKKAFGDDVDDAKGLPWTQEQAWAVLKLLSKRGEVPYYDVLLDFPFKGDQTPLRNMEHAELISITTQDGRPSTIRPGKPIFRWVFERLVNDPIFQATQDISFNDKVLATSEKTVQACEEELQNLRGIASMEAIPWWTLGIRRQSATSARARYLAEKMLAATKKIELMEQNNAKLKKVLAKGG